MSESQIGWFRAGSALNLIRRQTTGDTSADRA